MADRFAAENAAWGEMASRYTQKRAELKPISYDFVSLNMSLKGNYNGASSFNSARAKLMSDHHRLRSAMYIKPDPVFETGGASSSRLAPSEDVVKLKGQVDQTANKIESLGGNPFRGAVSGLMRVADVVSRAGYALRTSSLRYAEENAADGNTSFWEHVENAARPWAEAVVAPIAAPVSATLNGGEVAQTYQDMWEGLTGRSKTSGHDLLKVTMPEFSSDHKKWTSALAFGVDVAYDPLSWLTVGSGTLVTGGGKAAAAGAAKVLGKDKLSKNLLSNTIFTKTGRTGGAAALREGIYVSAEKPLLKKVAKIDKDQIRAVKAHSKGKTDKVKKYNDRLEKTKAIRLEQHQKLAAELDDVRKQHYTGVRLAYKAVARKSLGLGAYTDYGKGVNTAGLSGRSARAFEKIQNGVHDEIKASFRNADSPQSVSWRQAHADIINSGNKEFSYKNGTKTFTIADDYDQFVDEMAEIAFPKHTAMAVTKKDRGMLGGMKRADDAESKGFFTRLNAHLDDVSPYSVSKAHGNKGSKSSAALRTEEIAKKTSELADVKARRAAGVKKSPGDTEAMHQVKVADEEVAVLKDAAEQAEAASDVAKAQGRALDAAKAKAEAQTLYKNAAQTAKRATEARKVAEREEAIIQAKVDEWINASADAQLSEYDNTVAAIRAQDTATTNADQLADITPEAAAKRDQMIAAAAQFDTTPAELVAKGQSSKLAKNVREATAGDLTDEGELVGLGTMIKGDTEFKASPEYQRAINYRIAEEIQKTFEETADNLVAAGMMDDAEIVFDIMLSDTKHLLNQMFADTHVQVLTFLEAKGLSLMPEAASLDVLRDISKVVDTSPTGIRPMSQVLKGTKETDPFTMEVMGKEGTLKSYSNTPAKHAEAVEELRATIEMDINQAHDFNINELFRGYGWDAREIRFDKAVENLGVKEVIEDTFKTAIQRSELYLTDKKQYRMRDGTTASPRDIFQKFLAEAARLNERNHTSETSALDHYTVYDYWTFGDNAGKETQALYGVGTQKKANVGRAGYLDTGGKLDATAYPGQDVVNEAIQAIPGMDPEFLDVVSHVRGWLTPKETRSIIRNDKTFGYVKDAVADMLIPDLKKVTQVGDVSTADVPKVMETLGAHLQLLSDTSGSMTGAKKVLLAQKVFGTQARIHELNETVLLYNLHNTLVLGATPEIAAARIAARVEKFPLVSERMKRAAVEGVNNGAVGKQAPVGAVKKVDDTIDGYKSIDEVPSRLLVGQDSKNPRYTKEAFDNLNKIDDMPVDLTEQLNKAKQASTTAREAEAAKQTIAADASLTKQDAVQVSKSADDEVLAAQKAQEKVEAVDSNVNVAQNPVEPEGNAPGGFSSEPLTDAELASLDSLIIEITSDINVAGMHKAIAEAQDTMVAAMIEYDALVNEGLKDFDLVTRRMIKFAGMPIMPAGRQRSTSVTQYAGIIGMKEQQGRVHNWLNQRSWYAKWVGMARRPTNLHDATMEEMRQAASGWARNVTIANHKAIFGTYRKYGKNAELKADTKKFFDGGVQEIPTGLKPLQERLESLTNEVLARAQRAYNDVPDDTPEYLSKLNEQASYINDSLPRPYKLPPSVFSKGGTTSFSSNSEPWSREWLTEVSEYLDGNYPKHVLATRNLDKLNIQSFDYATQIGVTRIQGNTMVHDSMFDHFTFDIKKDMVEELNAARPDGMKYMRVQDHSSFSSISELYHVGPERYASEDMLDEMGKITRFMNDQMTKKTGTDYNFQTFEKMNNYWKGMVTTWGIPRYHIGNAMADGFLSLMDGTGPKSYKQAATVMTHSHQLRRKIGDNAEEYSNMLRPDLNVRDINNEREIATMARDIGDPTRAAHVTTISVKGRPVTLSSEDIYKAYMDFNLSQTQVSGNIQRGTTGGSLAKVNDMVLDMSNAREDYFRLAHFIHAIENEAKILGRSQQEIFKAARDRVIKYHFDYGDVSEVERLTVGKYIPFYKWSRNIVPLAMTTLVTNPKAHIIGNSANRAMGEIMFPTEEDADGNVIPIAAHIPDWVGDSNMMPIGSYIDPDGNEQARYAVLNLPLDQAIGNWIMPFTDPWFDPTASVTSKMSATVTGGVSTAGAYSHPLIKSLVQAATGRTMVPGDAFNAGEHDWLSSIVGLAAPGVPQIQRGLKDKDKGVMGGAWAADNLLGLTRETAATESNVRGSLNREKDVLRAQAAKAGADWVKENYPDLDPNSDEAKDILHDYFVSQGVLKQ